MDPDLTLSANVKLIGVESINHNVIVNFKQTVAAGMELSYLHECY